MIEPKSFYGTRQYIDPEHSSVICISRFLETVREAASAAKEVEDFHPVGTIVSSARAGSMPNCVRVPDIDPTEKITRIIIELLADERKRQGVNYEDLAAQIGVDRTTIGLWERGERSPAFLSLLRYSRALGLELSTLVVQAEAIAAGLPKRAAPQRPPRALNDAHFLNEAVLKRTTGITAAMLRAGIEHCHQTLDTIDLELELHGAKPIARLVELANLSSMIGNIVAEGVAVNSGGLYARNTPHTYPDLIPQKQSAVPLEVKIALETNRPKGHLPKPGMYLTFRYVLCDKAGKFTRGKEARGDVAYIWEARVGNLALTDFDLSNTPGDSGKTAVIKTVSFDRMTLIYFNPAHFAYGRAREGYAL